MFAQTENFTVFGGAYPTETHSNPGLHTPKNRSFGAIAPMFVACILGALATAGAVAETKRIHAIGYEFQTAGQAENQGLPAPREMLW